MNTATNDDRRTALRERAERFRAEVAALIPANWVIKEANRAVKIEAELPELTLTLDINPEDGWLLSTQPEVITFIEDYATPAEYAAAFVAELRAWWARINAALPPAPEA